MDFLNHREGGNGFLSGFLSGFPPFSFTIYSNWTLEIARGCMSLKKEKSQGKAVEVTVNSNEGKFLRLLSGFRPRIRPWEKDFYFLVAARMF